MKHIYQILILSLLCFISNTTNAQLVQYSSDSDNQGCIDCTTKSSNEGECYCSFPIQFGFFNIDFGNAANKTEFLSDREIALKREMVGGFSPDTFREVQINYFKTRESTKRIAEQYYTSSLQDYTIFEGNGSGIYTQSIKDLRLLELRKNELNLPNHQRTFFFGNVTYKGVKIEDITDVNYLNQEISNLTGTVNNTRGDHEYQKQWFDKWKQTKRDGILELHLAHKIRQHYIDLNYEQQMRFMTRYITAQVQKEPSILQIPFGDPGNIFTLEDQDYRADIHGVIRRQPGTGEPIEIFDPNVEEVLWDRTLEISGMESPLLNQSPYKEEVTPKLRDFLNDTRYGGEAVRAFMGLLESHINKEPLIVPNTVSFNHFEGYPPNHPSTLFQRFQNPFEKELAQRWHLANHQVLSSRYWELAATLSDLSFNLNYETEGALVRRRFATRIKWNNYTDEDLGRIFDIKFFGNDNENNFAEMTFANGLGTIFYDNGYPLNDFLASNFALRAALAISGGGEVDFEEKIIDDKLTGSEKCIHDLILNGDIKEFRNLLNNFIPNDSEFDIIISSVPDIVITLADGTEAHPSGATLYDEISDFMEIAINSKNAKESSNLITARDILHEYVHAEINRRLYSLGPRSDIDYDFAIAYGSYAEEFDVEHTFMAEQYLNLLSTTLESFHRTALKKDYDELTKELKIEYPNGLTIDFYRRICWEGLQNSESWHHLLENDPDEYQEVLKAVFLEREYGGKFDNEVCPND